MKLEGDVKYLEELDGILSHNSNCWVKRDGTDGYHSMLMTNERSRVFARVYLAKVNKTVIAVGIGFDYRDGLGDVRIRDDKVWKLVVMIPEIAKPMSKLYPYYTGRPHRRSELMRAINKLLS